MGSICNTAGTDSQYICGKDGSTYPKTWTIYFEPFLGKTIGYDSTSTYFIISNYVNTTDLYVDVIYDLNLDIQYLY